MSTVVPLRAYVNSAGIPTLVLIDLQQEYLASPRVLAIPEAADALENCRSALSHARAMGFPVAFVRWIGRTAFFNPATPFARWIDGFEPVRTDMVFERDRPSCYASASFAEVMNNSQGNFVIAGFAGEAACLSTAIDAFHRGHEFTFLLDASASHALDDVPARDVHRTVTKIVSSYGDVATTRTWIAATSHRGRGWELGNADESGRTAG
ncbi:MAG TPA: isochorismatase family protein [Xanthobacteraceae bacterium]|jgi:nicotinamidase-related amidase